MKIINKTHSEINGQAIIIAKHIAIDSEGADIIRIYGVPRGGVAPSYLVYGHLLEMTSSNVALVENIEEASVIIDDLIDSGTTEKRIKENYPNAKFYALFEKTDKDEWFNFPWENGVESTVEDIIARISQVSGASMLDTKIYLDRFLDGYKGVTG